jgi:hypothetical protein
MTALKQSKKIQTTRLSDRKGREATSSNGVRSTGSNPKYQGATANFGRSAIALSLNKGDASMITQSELNQFTGTSEHYKHWLKAFSYTDGVKYLADQANAHWLLDAIASHQPPLLRDEMLKEFQIWKLVVNVQEKTAQLICERDTDDVVVTQDIPYTDFPLPEIKLYLVARVLMLPSEY